MSTVRVLGDHYIENGKKAEVSGFTPDTFASIYYEVVRLINGKILFLPDHLERLKHSLSGSGISYPGDDLIHENLRLLITENSFREGNIRISIQKETDGKAKVLLQSFFISYHYPRAEEYKKGVSLACFQHVRPDPELKIWDQEFRKKVGAFIRDRDVYEALLHTSKGEITEGSRSNIFFIDRAGRILTVPEQKVLPGITRKYLMEIAAESGFIVREAYIRKESLHEMASVFISGTSPKVLPVARIDDLEFRTRHPMLQHLMKEFDKLLLKHLSKP